MHLTRLRLKNFQCFGPEPTVLDFEAMTYLLGPNGAGKTSVLTALSRMFAIDPQMRNVRHTDFHVPLKVETDRGPVSQVLWIEADFEFPELAGEASSPSVPSFFPNMRIDRAGEVPRVRIRLTATEDDTGYIDTTIAFVTETGEDGEPVTMTALDRFERAAIQVHYLPARRDPADHIAHTSNTLLGRLLRAVDWSAEQVAVGNWPRNSAIRSLPMRPSPAWTEQLAAPGIRCTPEHSSPLHRWLSRPPTSMPFCGT